MRIYQEVRRQKYLNYLAMKRDKERPSRKCAVSLIKFKASVEKRT